jgi:hypothetical protein
VWIFVHLLYLVGFESRVVVLLRWAWDFFLHRRGARIITGSPAQRMPAPTQRDAAAATQTTSTAGAAEGTGAATDAHPRPAVTTTTARPSRGRRGAGLRVGSVVRRR